MGLTMTGTNLSVQRQAPTKARRNPSNSHTGENLLRRLLLQHCCKCRGRKRVASSKPVVTGKLLYGLRYQRQRQSQAAGLVAAGEEGEDCQSYRRRWIRKAPGSKQRLKRRGAHGSMEAGRRQEHPTMVDPRRRLHLLAHSPLPPPLPRPPPPPSPPPPPRQHGPPRSYHRPWRTAERCHRSPIHRIGTLQPNCCGKRLLPDGQVGAVGGKR